MPKRKPPLVCLPDTTSLIHLRDIIISGRDARLWMWDEFEVKVSDEIQREVDRHRTRHLAGRHRLMPGQLGGKISRSSETLLLGLEPMEQSFLEPLGFSLNPHDDLGERHSCQLGIQLITRNAARLVIFLTDELKIMRENIGFVKVLFDTYPIGMVWNSLDFLLYLHLRHPNRFLYTQAEAVIRDVNILIGGTTHVQVDRLANYTKRLRHIDAARARLTTLWRS